MNRVDSLGERAVATVCHSASIFGLRSPSLHEPRRCRALRPLAKGETEQMLMAAALTSQQDRGRPRPSPAAARPFWLLTSPLAQAKYRNYPALSDRKMVFLCLSKMPVQKNGSPSALHHDNRVMTADCSQSWTRRFLGFKSFLALSGGH